MKILRFLTILMILCSIGTVAQQPQVSEPSPETLQGINSKWTNGIAPGYYPTCSPSTCASTLVLNIGAGTCFDSSGTRHAYAGGTLTMTSSATNYVYLTSSTCALTQNTSGYPTSNAMPLATVTATSTITAIVDNRTWFGGAGGSGCPLSNGVNPQTSNYPIVAGDSGKLITMNVSSGTATLPNPAPAAPFCFAIQNLNTTPLAVAFNSLNFNSGANPVSLKQYQMIFVWSNGTNYFGTRPIVSGTNVSISESTTGETLSAGFGGGGTGSSIWTEADVTGSRVAGTVYQNSTGGPMMVCIEGSSSGTAVTLLADGSNPPTTQIAITIPRFGGGGSASHLCGIVLNTQFYKLSTGGIFEWNEYTITKGAITDSGDIAGSRSITTTFQNTTSNLMLVAIQITNGSTGSTYNVYSDSSSTPTTEVYGQASSGASQTFTPLIPVLPGNYYKITSTSGGSSITHWHEYQWTLVSTTQTTGSATTITQGCCGSGHLNAYGTTLWVRVSATVCCTGTMFIVRNLGNSLYSTPIASSTLTGADTTSANERSLMVGLNPGETYSLYCDSSTCSSADWVEYSIQ